jgi:predicted dienelactone hydrolase
MWARRTPRMRWLAGIGALFALVLHAAGVALPGITSPARGATGGRQAAAAPGTPRGGYAIGTLTLTLVDRHRTIRLPAGRTVPRTLVTHVRYPAGGGPAGAEVPGAAPAAGPFPLVVFAHGFDVTPTTYARLLASWARAGYVVAAPLFPLTGPHAPGGPDESDVVNQPGDVSFAISSLLAASAAPGPLSGLIDPRHIAVAGHSDGAETALAAAFSRRERDARISAAMVLSGAEMSGIGGYSFQPRGPALLAAQGTRDLFNAPRYTDAYFRAARRPKYLLRLPGAGHLPPYTTEQPQLSIVEHVTRAFLDAYLKGSASALAGLAQLGNVPGSAALVSEP